MNEKNVELGIRGERKLIPHPSMVNGVVCIIYY